MQEIYQTSKMAAFASVKDHDTLVVGISFHGSHRPGGGNLARLDQKETLGFSFVDIACTMSFPYPYGEVLALVTAVGEFARSFRRVVTYGASLGGFVALNFAPHFGAQAAIAASPPFSLNPEKIPSEKRWGEYRRSVTSFPWDHIENGLSVLREIYLLYDPLTPDVAHIESIRKAAPHATLLPLRHGGHPVTRVLEQGRTIGRIITAVAKDRMEPDFFRDAVRESRPVSPTYLKNLADALPRRRDDLRVRLLKMAQEQDKSTETLLTMFPPLVRLGRGQEAQALARSIVEIEAGNLQKIKEVREENARLKRVVSDLKQQLVAGRR